jgi:hypothetical protein
MPRGRSERTAFYGSVYVTVALIGMMLLVLVAFMLMSTK